MRIWIDILTPKQACFLGELERRLEASGHDVFKTTRRYREVNQLLELKGINAVIVGKHGGPTLEGKLIASAQRIAKLARIISKLQPNLSISFSSPEAARIAYGLAIPHYAINDSPHAIAVARLTVPLSKKLFTPKIIPRNVWVKFGADPKAITQYDALDPVVWLKNFMPNPRVLYEIGLDNTKPIVVFRAEESFASYLLDRISERESVIVQVINNFLENYDKPVQVVALPRYAEQCPSIRAAFHDRVVVPKKVIDGPSLLFFSSVFIGAGGTMTAEAALLGIPTISCYPKEPTLVEKYLIRRRLVSRITNPKGAARKVSKILDNFESFHEKQQEKAKLLMSPMEDPLEVILKSIESDYPTTTPA